MENASKNQAKKNFLSFYFNPRDKNIITSQGELDGLPVAFNAFVDPRLWNQDIILRRLAYGNQY